MPRIGRPADSCPSLHAANVIQSFDISETLYDGPAAAGSFDAPPIVRTFQPFDSNLGTLESVEFFWNLTMEAEGTTGAGGGSMSFSFGATLYVDDVDYNGFGSGGGNGGPADTFVSASANDSQTTILLPTDTEDYQIAIWNKVTGSSDFTISGYASDGTFSAYEFFGTFSDANISYAGDSVLSLHGGPRTCHGRPSPPRLSPPASQEKTAPHKKRTPDPADACHGPLQTKRYRHAFLTYEPFLFSRSANEPIHRKYLSPYLSNPSELLLLATNSVAPPISEPGPESERYFPPLLSL